MTDAELHRKHEELERAVRAGDTGTAFALVGVLKQEHEERGHARGVARCAAAARQHQADADRRHGDSADPGEGSDNAAKLADLFDGWAGTATRPPAPEPPPEPAHEPEPGAGEETAPGPEADPEAVGEDEEPAPRRGRRSAR